jgi:hypothetical protein
MIAELNEIFTTGTEIGGRKKHHKSYVLMNRDESGRIDRAAVDIS